MDEHLAFVIEDDANLALAFAEALELAEYQVEVLHDGKTARARLEETIPAIVILDLHIPHIMGTDLLQYIRSDERLENIRVIVATADYRLAEGLNRFANMVLVKPVGFEQLKDLATRLKPL
jgi:DNA-binding response OmpR family regulator